MEVQSARGRGGGEVRVVGRSVVGSLLSVMNARFLESMIVGKDVKNDCNTVCVSTRKFPYTLVRSPFNQTDRASNWTCSREVGVVDDSRSGELGRRQPASFRHSYCSCNRRTRERRPLCPAGFHMQWRARILWRCGLNQLCVGYR